MATICHATPGTTKPSNSPREDSDDGWLADQYSRYSLDHCPPLQVISFHANEAFCFILSRWSESTDSCVPATDESFIGANGITISADGSTVFVNDPPSKSVTVMTRDKDSGRLSKVNVIDMPVAADNIEYDDQSGQIIVGTIPDLKRAMKKIDVPGGMAVLSNANGGDWEYKSVLEHDGTKLSQISAASRLGKRIVLGSPFSEGILSCSL